MPEFEVQALPTVRLASNGRHWRRVIGISALDPQRTSRREIANDIKAEVERLSFYLPKPKPYEIAWVNDERAEIDKLNEYNLRGPRSITSILASEGVLASHMDMTASQLTPVVNSSIIWSSGLSGSRCW